jgi:hypothetical protein
MNPIMLVEVWEWLRGYHKWTEVEAKVQFLKEDLTCRDASGKEVQYSSAKGDRLIWRDVRGVAHHVDFQLPENSAKYRFADGEAATLRYNPANPEQYYVRKLLKIKVHRFFAAAATVITVAAMVIGDVWIREMLGCSR